YDGDLFDAIVKTIAVLEGSYALGILNSEKPEEMYAVRRSSPLIVGLSDDGNFIASDVPAILSFTRKIYYLNDEEIVLLTPKNVTIFDTKRNVLEKEISTIKWDISAAEKGGYDHFMIKEIMEQPTALAATITPRIDTNGHIILDGISLTKEELLKVRRISIIACGSAYHVGIVGKYVIEELCRIPVSVEYASEFRYANPIVDENSLVIIISQSGETADTLAALREAKKRGAKILSVVNVVGSSIANESDNVLYTWAGPEIAVATTKAYTAQVSVLYLLALRLAYEKKTIDSARADELFEVIAAIPKNIEEVLKNAEHYQYLASLYQNGHDLFFIGRGQDYALCCEGSLKLKEISYMHSESYPAGELKHGTISLITEGIPVIACATDETLLEKTVSNIKEVKARGASVVFLSSLNEKDCSDFADNFITIPKVDVLIRPIIAIVPLQIFAYYTSVLRGCDVDKPRNLAKSVTVE
ncbi:MAG: glutamine--fructose-6-phosphate transaminase (isomerizing), partial [Eubacteriales bacterium]